MAGFDTRFSQVRELLARERSFLLPIVLLIVLVGLVTAKQPLFLDADSLRALAMQASLILLISVGQTLIIVIGSLDLSVAAVTSFSAVVLAEWLPHLGWLALLAVIAMAMAITAAEGFLFATVQAPSFIVTLGGLSLFSGIALSMTQGNAVAVFGSAHDPVAWAFGNVGGIPRSAVLAVVVVIIVGAVLRWTNLGRDVYAIGNSESAAALSGVRIRRVKVIVFALSGLSAAITAVALVAQSYSASYDIATSLLLPGITAVVIGGTPITGGHGGLRGTVVGALIIVTLQIGLTVVGVSADWQQIVYGLVLVIGLALTTDRSKLGLLK